MKFLSMVKPSITLHKRQRVAICDFVRNEVSLIETSYKIEISAPSVFGGLKQKIVEAVSWLKIGGAFAAAMGGAL